MKEKSSFELERLQFRPPLPKVFQEKSLMGVEVPTSTHEELRSLFPHTCSQGKITFRKGSIEKKGLRVGVVLSGGQAPGGHNVIIALFEGLKRNHPDSQLIGFLEGPKGILEGKSKEITEAVVEEFRNTGGFDMIGSGRTKIETPEQFDAALNTAVKHSLDGIVVIGGDDSNTNAALLAEFFREKGCKTSVVGVPKTIDGDLKGGGIELSFGFDTATKTYSEAIGNIARDALSAKKYTHFVKIMGRSASHVALECALNTHPNLTLIGEEIAEKKKTLAQVTHELADLIAERSAAGKEYGVIVIPEGVIEFIPEMKGLIGEINAIYAKGTHMDVVGQLSRQASDSFSFLPEKVQHQLLLERDPHGNVQVSQIATEELLIHAVRNELKKRANFRGKFTPVAHFLGYEGRSAFPTNFDATYCQALGLTAALLIVGRHSGYMATVAHLAQPVSDWEPVGIPLTSLIHLEERKGKERPVVKKALVALQGEPFARFASQRESWKVEDHYLYPGPIQFLGPSSHIPPQTLLLEQKVRAVR